MVESQIYRIGYGVLERWGNDGNVRAAKPIDRGARENECDAWSDRNHGNVRAAKPRSGEAVPSNGNHGNKHRC